MTGIVVLVPAVALIAQGRRSGSWLDETRAGLLLDEFRSTMQ